MGESSEAGDSGERERREVNHMTTNTESKGVSTSLLEKVHYGAGNGS